MDDWESHKDLLKAMRLTEKRSLNYIINYMDENFMFHHSKAQYEARFKKWGFRKNINDREWKHVCKKIHQRRSQGRPDSMVLFNGVPISNEKVKKEIGRHATATYQFISAQMPTDTPSPDGDVIVCTPPATHQPLVVENLPITTFAEHDSLALQETTLTRRSRSPLTCSQNRYSSSMGGQSSIACHSNVIVDGTPFFHFQNIFRSEEVRSGFQKTLTVEGDLCDDLLDNFWPEDSSARDCPSNVFEISPPSPSWAAGDGMDDIMPTSSLSNHSTQLVYKPFGVNLVQWSGFTFQWEAPYGFDVLQYYGYAEVALPKLLAMMPLRAGDNVESNTTLLLGTPNIQAAHLIVETGVYLVTNNIKVDSLGQKLVTWMLATVPWPILRPILSTDLLTIREFSKHVFLTAIQDGNFQVVKDLLQLPWLQDAVRSSGWYLCEAVRISHSGIIYLLLSAGADPNKEEGGDPFSTPLPLELVESIGIARLLVEAGATVNVIRSPGPHSPLRPFFNPPLVAATAKENFELVQYLIDMGADVNNPGILEERIMRIYGLGATNRYEVTALTMAVINGNFDIVELLLNHGANANANVRAYEILSYFKDKGEDIFIHPSPATLEMGQKQSLRAVRIFSSLLSIAVAIKSQKIVKLLVDFGSCCKEDSCNLKDIDGRNSKYRADTALQIAVGNGDIEIADFLLRNGANVNKVGYSATGYPITSLVLAMDRCDAQLIDLLLREGADFNISYYGLTLLQAARLKNSCTQIVDILLAKKAPEVLVLSNEQQNYDLQEAVTRGDKEWVKRSLALGGVVSMRTLRTGVSQYNVRRDFSILHLALGSQSFDPEIFQLIVAEAPDLAAHKTNCYMEPLLHQAVSVPNLKAAEILIRAGVDLNEVYEGHTPLMRCVASTQDLAMISLILSAGADLNAVAGDKNYTTALQACLSSLSLRNFKDFRVFLLLMDKQASINAPVAPHIGLSELAYAVRCDEIEIIQLLLDRGADVNTPAAMIGGRTALQEAVDRYIPDLDIIRLLLDRGANVNAPAAMKGGRTALQAAVSGSIPNLDIIRLLLDRGANVNAPAAREYGDTALQAAVSGPIPNLDIIRLLLDRGANVNAPGSEIMGFTALERAAREGHFQIVALFLQIGADVNNRSTPFSETALCAAASEGRLDTVHLLLQNGADMDLPPNERYLDAIREARRCKHLVVAELLESWPDSEAGRKATAEFGYLYKGPLRVEEISGGDVDSDEDFDVDYDEDMT